MDHPPDDAGGDHGQRGDVVVSLHGERPDRAPASQGPALLIYGINYWPEVTGIAPYTTGLAEYLVSQGWSVTVATGMPHYPQWKIPERYRGKMRSTEHRNGVTVHRFCHVVPSTQTAIRRALYELTYLAHTARLTGVKPDMVLGVVPSLGGGVRAVRAARTHHVPSAVLFQDLMGNAAAQSGIRGGQRAARVTRSVETWVARRADNVAIVAEGFRSYFEDAGVSPDAIAHIPNWTHVTPSLQAKDQTRRRLGWTDDMTVIVHAGNMGLKQGLEHVIAAARLAERKRPADASGHLLFVLMGDGSQRATLERLAAGCKNVAFVDPVAEDEFMDMLAAADILLVNERKSVVNMSLPSKLTSYFAAGRPIVAATPLDGETAQEVERSGAGIAVEAECTEALIAAVDRIAGDKDLAQRFGEAGRHYATTRVDARSSLERMECFLYRLLYQGA